MVRVEVANDGLGYIFQEITWVPSLYHFSYDASFCTFPFLSTSLPLLLDSTFGVGISPPPAPRPKPVVLVPLTNKIICSVAGL